MGLWPCKVAGGVVPVLSMEICRLRRATASLILITSAVDEGQCSASRPGSFTAGKESWYALNRRLGGPQSLSRGFEGRNKSFPPVRMRTLDRTTHRLVAILPTLSRPLKGTYCSANRRWMVSFTPWSFTDGEREPGTHWTGRLLSTRCRLDNWGKKEIICFEVRHPRCVGSITLSDTMIFLLEFCELHSYIIAY